MQCLNMTLKILQRKTTLTSLSFIFLNFKFYLFISDNVVALNYSHKTGMITNGLCSSVLISMQSFTDLA